MRALVSFTREDMSRFREMAAQRNQKSRRYGGMTHTGTSDALEAHISGLKAEHAVAQIMGGSVDDTISLTRGNTLGNIILPDNIRANAKYRTKRGWSYALKNDNPDTFWGDIGFLVWPEFTHTLNGSVEIIGWISKQEFCAIAHSEQFISGKPRLAVLPSQLHPVTMTPRAGWIAPPVQEGLFS